MLSRSHEDWIARVKQKTKIEIMYKNLFLWVSTLSVEAIYLWLNGTVKAVDFTRF